MEQQTIKQGVSAETATGVSLFLTPVVRNMIALAVNAKQAHWHLRGMNFIALHEFLDQVHEHANDAADEAAERIIALGLPVDARLETVAAKATNPTLTPGFQQAEDVLREMIAQLDATRVVLQEAIDGLGDIDAPSQDVAIALTQQLDKDRWFLTAHLGA